MSHVKERRSNTNLKLGTTTVSRFQTFTFISLVNIPHYFVVLLIGRTGLMHRRRAEKGRKNISSTETKCDYVIREMPS